MSWLAENWVWVVLIGGFVGLHVFGHRAGGGCGGHAHGSHGKGKGEGDDAPRPGSHEREM